MLSLVKPKYFLPIHGEYRMQRVHKDLAIETGVDPDKIFILENGDVVAFNEQQEGRIAGHIPSAGDVYIDGTSIGDVSGSIIRERKALSDDGMFSLVLTIDSKEKKLLLEPQVVSRGFIYMKDSEELTKSFVEIAKQFINEEMAKVKVLNLADLKKSLSEKLEEVIYQKTDRKPIVIPIFMEISSN